MTAPELTDVDPLLVALRDPAVVARFWEKVDRRSPGKCWEWSASRNTYGYGQFHLQGRGHGAHRVAYALHHGETVPGGLVVRHRCDYRPCVNPDHLELGTIADNNRDKVERGWQHTKFTPAQVAELRRRVRAGESMDALSGEFQVGRLTVRDAVRGRTKTWSGPVLGEPPVLATRSRKDTRHG